MPEASPTVLLKALAYAIISIIISSVDASNEEVNGYRLPDSPILMNSGYDWWWHNLVAVSRVDGSLKPFFFEFYIVNPGLAQDKPVFGMNGTNKPSYAMVTAGTWGKDAKKINNFYPVSAFSAMSTKCSVTIGATNFVNDTHTVGSVALSAQDAAYHPEYFSDSGSISWSLEINKVLSYDPGYAVSELPRLLNLFQMFWYVKGIHTEYSGTITYNGQVYDVFPKSSYGYQDKNWGTEYTNPWYWLSTNKLVSRTTGKSLELTSLDCGGGKPVAVGLSLGIQTLIAFYYKGTLYEYNFSKLTSTVTSNVTATATTVYWSFVATNPTSKLVVNFSAPKDTMIKIKYESPADGLIKFKNLWNTGYAAGTVELYSYSLLGGYTLVDVMDGDMGGAEYGEY